MVMKKVLIFDEVNPVKIDLFVCDFAILLLDL